MPCVAKRAVAIVLLGAVLAPVTAGAQTVLPGGANKAARAAGPANEAARLTGKERLGEKWQDEQRVDNCKVPLDKRGAAPRPDSCAPAPAQ
jgi:hypothetical protein